MEASDDSLERSTILICCGHTTTNAAEKGLSHRRQRASSSRQKTALGIRKPVSETFLAAVSCHKFSRGGRGEGARKCLTHRMIHLLPEIPQQFPCLWAFVVFPQGYCIHRCSIRGEVGEARGPYVNGSPPLCIAASPKARPSFLNDSSLGALVNHPSTSIYVLLDMNVEHPGEAFVHSARPTVK